MTMMDRRVFAGALITLPLAGRAQPATSVKRLGYVAANTPSISDRFLAAFRQGLADHGWVEGRNVVIEARYADGQPDRVAPIVAEVVRAKVDVIVSASSATTHAAKAATQSIPIVMTASADALSEGLVDSLARPGGNVTGMTFLASPEIAGKQLQLLKEIAPAVSRVAVLSNPANRSHAAYARNLKARAVGVALQVVEVADPDQLERAFAAIVGARAGALLVLTDSMFVGLNRRIVDGAAQNRLPALYSQRAFVEAGGLMCYGPSLLDMSRRAATHVDKILRGEKPGDIPVEQPSKFEMVINLKTAKALGLSIPQSSLLRADEVLQ
jgi:putative ABC transport system substrate-binding protein